MLKPNLPPGRRRKPTRADIVERALRKHLPDFAKLHFDQAISGDIVSLGKLLVAAPNDLRGSIALLFYLRQHRPEIMRCVIETVWIHDHDELIKIAGSRSTLKAMSESAQFELPAEMLDTVQVWRGTSGLSIADASLGYSWTTDRDVACWFAIRRAEMLGSPLVLTSHVKRNGIAFYSEERCEFEAVIFDIQNAEIAGTERDWRQGCAVYESAKNERNRASMNSLLIAA